MYNIQNLHYKSSASISSYTISHQKAVSKDCCLLWKIYKIMGWDRTQWVAYLMGVREMQVSFSIIIIWQEWSNNETQSFSK